MLASSISMVSQVMMHPAEQIPAKESNAKDVLRITAAASREQATMGSAFGIMALIENTSDHVVYLNPMLLTMTAPPELDPQGPQDWYAIVPGPNTNSTRPTGNRPGGDTDESRKWDAQYINWMYNKVVYLSPGAQTHAFWSGSTRPLRHELFDGIRFSPGKYKLSITCAYWDTSEGAAHLSEERHLEASEFELPVNAPEFAILIGALLGGVAAYGLMPNIRAHIEQGSSIQVRVLRHTGGLLRSILLSTIVTILLSRLSGSQFLIKVTVDDFWGAIALGFIASASGTVVLQKITGMSDSSTKPQVDSGSTTHWAVEPEMLANNEQPRKGMR